MVFVVVLKPAHVVKDLFSKAITALCQGNLQIRGDGDSKESGESMKTK